MANLIHRPNSSSISNSSPRSLHSIEIGSSSSGASHHHPSSLSRPMHSRNSSGSSITSTSSASGSYPPCPRSNHLQKSSTKIMAAPPTSMIQKQYAKITAGFTSLSNSPPELWKAYLLKFLDSYAYFSFSLVFTLFLSDDFGMSDVQAGSIYGAWGALITVFGLFTGTVIDNLGVAKCLRIGFVLSFFSRVAIFACNSREVLLICLLITLPFSNCLGIPVLSVGIRRYTNDENRGFAFGLFYVIMNVGALVGLGTFSICFVFCKWIHCKYWH
mmetsp:Transcript_18543/g.34127  ORF Transcript_18543/g.34127 Transcript_18543/m.34127 type:complete len:272 (+) Transcript_18543:119-934(+)